MRNITIFAPSHGTHSCAKILFAYAEKDGRAKIATNENIPFTLDYTSPLKDVILERENGGLSFKFNYGLEKVSALIEGSTYSWCNLCVNGKEIGGIHNVMDNIHVRRRRQEHTAVPRKPKRSPAERVRFGEDELRSERASAKMRTRDLAERVRTRGEPTNKATVMLGLRAVDLVAEYTGHPYDAVLGMYFAEARMYDAADRRFVAVDPVKGSVANAATLAQYTYVLDNPLKYVDPWGLLSVTYGNGDIAYSISQSGEFLLDFDYGVTRLQSAKGNIVRISRSLTKDHLFYNISYNSANVSTGVLFDSDKSVSATTRGITYGVGSMILGTPLNDKYTGAIQYPLVTYDYFAKIVCRISSGSILGPSIIFDSLDEAYEYMDMYLVGKLKDGVLVDKAVQYAAWYGPINSVADFVTGEFAGSKNSTKFDGEILGWTNYWNSKIQQNPGRYVGQTMIRAEVVKAMIAQESSMGTATSKNAQRDIMQTLVPGDYAVWYAAGLNPLELGRFHTEPGVSGRYNAIDAIRPDGSLTHWEIVGSFNASDLKDSAAFGASGIGLLQDVVYVGGGKNGQERLYDQRNVTNRMSIAVGTGYLAWKINGAANGRGSESKGIYGYGTGADYVGVINMYLRQLRVSELNA